jgi:hypothetical protein
MTVVEHEIRLLVERCGRCGTDAVGDNTGSGRAWQHLDPEQDDHFVVFGTPAPQGVVSAPSGGLDALAALLEEDDDLTAGLPSPGTPRAVADEELGDGRAGTRQMVNAALAAGFTIEASLCRGAVKIARHHDERGYRYVDSLLVGFRRDDGRGACGVWERIVDKPGAKFAFVLAFTKGGQGVQGSAELKTYLKGASR